MKSIFRFAVVFICVLVLASGIASAQDLQQQLSTLGQAAAVGYATPFLNGLGNDINSGIYSSADLHNVLGFDIGVSYSNAKINDADKTYTLTIPSMSVDPSMLGINSVIVNGISVPIPTGTKLLLTAGMNYSSSIIANTAVGPKDKTVIRTIGGSSAVISSTDPNLNGKTITLPSQSQQITSLPEGYDLGSIGLGGVPVAMPQFALGLPFGLEVIGRWVPPIKTDQGKISAIGLGLRYDIDQWIPLCPVDIAVHFMTQKMTFKSSADQDIFTGNSTAYGIEVSKKLLVLTLYGGFQLESSSLTLNDYIISDIGTGQTVTIPGFEVKGNNKSRVTVGARMLLLFLNVHADYSIATNPIFTLGVGFSFR